MNGAPFFGMTATGLGEPTTGDFGGVGPSMLTRTSPTVLAAEGAPQAGAAITPANAGLAQSPVVWVGIGVVVLLAYKAWTERKGDGHVADLRIGISQLFVLAFMVAVARHLALATTGLAVKANVPYATQASRFFAL